MKNGVNWTLAEYETLRTLWTAGKTASEIAALMPGRSKCSVIGAARRLNLTSRTDPIKRSKPRTYHRDQLPDHTPVSLPTHTKDGALSIAAILEYTPDSVVPVQRYELDDYFMRMDTKLKLTLVNAMRSDAGLPSFRIVRPS
jgi:hypothetical protein